MSPKRKKIGSETDFTVERKKGDHERGEAVRTAVNKCVVWGVYIVTGGILLVVGILGSLLVFHAITTKDYDMMWNALSYIFTAVGGYILAYFRSNGVGGDN